jgi:hypothetical protein
MSKGSISKKEKSDALKKGIRKNEKEEEEFNSTSTFLLTKSMEQNSP